jgi:hypothetical protein
VIVTNPATTNSAGIATFTVTDSATEAVSYTATAGGVTLTQTAYVVFGDLTVSPTASTVVASPSPAPTGPSPSGGGSEVTTTLLTSGGAHPVADKNVELMASGSAVASPPVAITNAQGQATFIVTDATAESVTVTAVDETDAGLQVGQTTVEFVAPTVSPTLSTIATVSSAPPATTTPADGTSPFNVFVTLRYTNGQEVRGDVVTLTPTVPDLQVDITPDTPVGSSTPGATDFTGVAEFQVRDTVAESVAFTATDVTAGVTLAPATPLVLTFTAGPVDLNQSSVTASPPTVPANGTSTATVAVDLTDHFGNPLAGQTVSLSQGTGHSVISPPSAVTNSAGVATFTATNTVNDDVTYTALDKSDGDLAVTQTASVRFRIPTEAGESTVTANTTTVPADGFTPAKVTVTLYDGQGNLVPGHAVSLQATPSDGAEIIPVQINGSTAAGTTDAQGQALFWVLDTKAETVGVTATDTTDATPLSEQLSITFAAGVPVVSQSSVVAAPTSVPADGVSTSTVTVTLEDTYDNPVPGKTVSLTAGGGSFTISPASAVTNPSGQAVFTVSDPTPEYVTFTARDTTDSLSIGTATVTFGVPPPVGANSTFFATPSAVPADGTTASTLSVFLRDADRRGVAGRTVILHASAGHAVLTPTFAVTNANGEATFAVTDATAQTITFTATDATDGLTLPQTVPVQFTNGGAPPSGPVSWTANGANGPFSSGQFVAIDVAANTTLASDTGLFIEECAAPSGQPPTSPSQCDAKTAQTRELFANSDGSASYVDYPVYSLPDLAGLDETSPGGPTCNLSDQCVFYVGVNPGNFSLPHLFSSAFFVNPGDGTDDGANPGNGLPEAPIIVLFPLLAAGLIGAVVLRRRRRSARSS